MTWLVVKKVSALAQPVAGSVQGRCERCDELVWISEAGEAFLREGRQLLCDECVKTLPAGLWLLSGRELELNPN